jgi:hypothetical protein
MNYYQRKASRFQPLMIVPNNSPTTSGKRFAKKPTSPAPQGKFIKQSTLTPFENTPDCNPISAVPRTPWNSPAPVTQSTYMNNLFSPVNTSFLALHGQNQTSRPYATASPTGFNFYQNNFQQTVRSSEARSEKTYDDVTPWPRSPPELDLAPLKSAGSEDGIEEEMKVQFNHSSATPHNSPMVSIDKMYSQGEAIDSFVELLCAGEQSSEERTAYDRFNSGAARMTDCSLCIESTKDRMIAQYLHSPATPYSSPFYVHSNLRLIAFDEIEIMDIITSPLKRATQEIGISIPEGKGEDDEGN